MALAQLFKLVLLAVPHAIDEAVMNKVLFSSLVYRLCFMLCVVVALPALSEDPKRDRQEWSIENHTADLERNNEVDTWVSFVSAPSGERRLVYFKSTATNRKLAEFGIKDDFGRTVVYLGSSSADGVVDIVAFMNALEEVAFAVRLNEDGNWEEMSPDDFNSIVPSALDSRDEQAQTNTDSHEP